MSATEPGEVSPPNWRDPSNYDYTRNLTREAWAVEFLDRNPNYTALVTELRRFGAHVRHESPTLCVIAAPVAQALRPWGLHFRRTARPPAGG